MRRQIIRLAASLALLQPAFGFHQRVASPEGRWGCELGRPVGRRSALVAPAVDTDAEVAAAGLLSDPLEQAKLFGRLADKELLLDVPGAGTPEMRDCCHGGCDNCDYSRIFDQMRAGKPKWVAGYAERELIDGRRHVPRWRAAFGGEGVDADAPLDRAAFIEAIAALEYVPSMGPRTPAPPAGEPPSPVALGAFFDALAGDSGALSANQMGESLCTLTGQEHGSMWAPFSSSLEE